MTRFKAHDPFARELYKDPSSLKITENMFKAAVSEGAKTLEVRATDSFGRVYTKTINR